MKRILAAANVDVLAQFAWSKVLLAFDFDGTLAPIVEDRDEAHMRDSTSELFERVCRLYPCAVISGRSRDDVVRRVNGAPLRYVMGNHGLEPGPHMGAFEHQMAEVRPVLEQMLVEHQGVRGFHTRPDGGLLVGGVCREPESTRNPRARDQRDPPQPQTQLRQPTLPEIPCRDTRPIRRDVHVSIAHSAVRLHECPRSFTYRFGDAG